MPNPVGQPIKAAVDGENNSIRFDWAYPLLGSPAAALSWLREHHGKNLFLLPISGSSCGGGIMQSEAPADGSIIGLRFDPPAEPQIHLNQQINLDQIALDEIAINVEQQRISAGAGITLAQLNHALRDTLGSTYRVLGADLTSYQYAAVGATFMTGGMGPQRRYFSESVVAIAIFNGDKIVRIDGDELNGYAGTYGWSGLVTAVECQFHEIPPNEIAFMLPISNDPQSLAGVLARLAPFARLEATASPLGNLDGGLDVILGIEHVSCAAMQPLLEQGQDNPASHRAIDLQNKCAQADADGLLFINGVSARTTDEFLFELVDNRESDLPTIAGIALDHAELFTDPDEMRDLREAIPYAARMQTPNFRHLYKNHTDAVIQIHPGKEDAVMRELWQINCDYVAAVETLFAEQEGIYGSVLVYGHLNPHGVDPHNRVTMACDNQAVFGRVRTKLLELRAEYYRSMAGLCTTGDASFIGGEKTADSEREIFAALGGTQRVPTQLQKRFRQQQEKVKNAAAMFNWRALPPYR